MKAAVVQAYWQESEKELLELLGTSEKGLSEEEASKRLQLYGRNEFVQRKSTPLIVRFILKFKNPLVLILLLASLISAFLGELSNFIIIAIIITMSVVIDALQERHAESAAESLQRKVSVTATVIRRKKPKEAPISELVLGDIIMLSAGDIIPADARVLEVQELMVDQSVLTGESYPQEKQVTTISGTQVDFIDRKNSLFMGTHVQSGAARAVVVKTGSATELGTIATSIAAKRPETEFEKGIKAFGYLLMKTTLVLVLFVFFVNAFLHHSVLTSFLFALALAVGLTPELLPVIMTINLAKGAIRMSKKHVIVKYLPAIVNFGSMNVCCMDKTGTLTENRIELEIYEDAQGKESKKVLLFGYLNAIFQSGLKSPLEEAVLRHGEVSHASYTKVQELPFDFFRRRLSVVVSQAQKHMIITKGAPEEILSVCDISHKDSAQALDRFRELSAKGFRVLAVAYRMVPHRASYTEKDEANMTYLGLMAFYDPPKRSSKAVLKDLLAQGVAIKILTGDGDLVTQHVCDELGLPVSGVVLGNSIDHMSDHALGVLIEKTTIFARLNPIQKNRIILLLKQRGAVVGYLGDGINDAPSLKTADIGISVNNAVDIAKESADVILLKKDLRVLLDGVREGRKTYGNIMKYLMMGTSSNFGNMVSMAGASLFLPFLPMLPVQILLNNLLYDFSELAVPGDTVDEEYIRSPKKWDIRFIRKFMLTFGPISSLIDFCTFGILLFIFHSNQAMFQTGWFVESLVTQSIIIFSIRTRIVPFFASASSKLLASTSIGIAIIALIIPYTPLAHVFGFRSMPFVFMIWLGVLLISYFILVEVAKKILYKKVVVY
ncbi:MAG TPA: magnesium-translocating P-type ATPase [Candidatus Andersenbacteria bacterium]|nr:magnesium-translocating P-type ATPase [Candidatus Andersenbacteria bacterium]